MQLINNTSSPARLSCGAVGETGLRCELALNATYELGAGGATPVERDPWPVLNEPLETPHGVFPPDVRAPMRGVKLWLLGTVRAAAGRSLERALLRIQLGDFCREVAVIGDRRWEQRGDALAPSAPAPFSAIALTADSAFGGAYVDPWGALTHPENPLGKGFYGDSASAVGQPLPNLECPDQLITSPGDRPMPVLLGPLPALDSCADHSHHEHQEQAPPEAPVARCRPGAQMSLPAVCATATLQIEGLDQGGAALAARLPACPVHATLRAGADQQPLALELQTIIVLGDQRRLVLGWTAATRLALRPRELRRVTLESRTAEAAA